MRRVRQRRVVAGGAQRFDLGIACEFAQLSGADFLAEKQGRRIRQLVRFVEDHGIAGRQQFGQPFIAQHDVGEKQMMIHDDHVGSQRFLACVHHEALVEVCALAAKAIFTGRRDVAPNRSGLGHVGEFALVSGGRGTSKGLDALQISYVRARRKHAARGGALEVVMADVVAAALEQRDGDRHFQRFAHEREIALKKLILQRLRAGGNDHLAARQQRRNEVGEGLAGARARFGDQLTLRVDGVRDCLRHRELLRARAKSGE